LGMLDPGLAEPVEHFEPSASHSLRGWPLGSAPTAPPSPDPDDPQYNHNREGDQRRHHEQEGDPPRAWLLRRSPRLVSRLGVAPFAAATPTGSGLLVGLLYGLAQLGVRYLGHDLALA